MGKLGSKVICSQQNSVGHGNRVLGKSARVRDLFRPCVCFLRTIESRTGLLLLPEWLRFGEWGITEDLERERAMVRSALMVSYTGFQ